ncbi:MAG: transposase [Chloroflexi bacterium]|nr:transposase [Chloroflexota bacterium]
MKRIPPSERVAKQLAELVDGKATVSEETELRGLLLRLGVQRVLQELLEAEQREFLGAERYERGQKRRGQRNGYEPTHVDSAEGRIDLWAPQVRGSGERCTSRLVAFLRGRSAVLERLVGEMYAHGLCPRAISKRRSRMPPVAASCRRAWWRGSWPSRWSSAGRAPTRRRCRASWTTSRPALPTCAARSTITSTFG